GIRDRTVTGVQTCALPISPEFCAIPKHGMIQFHPSVLPLHRGPASIPWAIIRGRSETGLTIFRPTPGLDEGPVILQKRVAIGPRSEERRVGKESGDGRARV